MDFYPRAALERAMKVQGVILRAMAKRITRRRRAAEIIGISDRPAAAGGAGTSGTRSLAMTGCTTGGWAGRVPSVCR